MKKIITVLLCAAMLLSLAACGMNNPIAANIKTVPANEDASNAENQSVARENDALNPTISTEAPIPADEDVYVPYVTEPTVPESATVPAEYSVFEDVLSAPVKRYSYNDLCDGVELSDALTYVGSVQDMEFPCYSPQAFCVTDDGEIAIADTLGARLMVFDAASGRVKRIVNVGGEPVRVTKNEGVYYVLIPNYNTRIVKVNPDDTTEEIPLPQLETTLGYAHVSEFYVEDGRLIMTVITESSISTKAVSLSDGTVTSLYTTEWKLAGGMFTVTRGNRTWSFPAESASENRSARIDVLKVDEQGNLYVIQEVPIDGQEDDGLYQVYDPDGRLINCCRIKYFMDSYESVRYGRIVGFDGALYEMYCNENEVRIVRLVP